MLFGKVCECSTLKENVWTRKWSLGSWGGGGRENWIHAFIKEKYQRKRWKLLQILWNDKKGTQTRIRCTSHQLCEDRSETRKSSNPMQILSWKDAWQGESETELDQVLVTAIEERSHHDNVYCIDVEDDHNFFANGILVHNCLDDGNNAQDVESDVKRASSLNWHDNAWRSRVNDPNTARKLYVAQRTHDADIIGHVLEKESNRWVSLILPMEYDPDRKCITYANDGTGPNLKKKLFEDPRKERGELLNPKRFNAETARTEKEAMSERAWNAQYQQQPEGAGGLILKRKWWRSWVYPENHKLAGKEMPMPSFFEIIQVYDTAFETKEQDDYSARTTWGLFVPSDEEAALLGGFVIPPRKRPDNDEEVQRPATNNKVCAMMLDMMYEKMEYPDLRDEAVKSNNDFLPDKILIEKKASGHSLIQELRRSGLPVVAVKVQGDLESRVNAASLLLKKGCIFYVPRTWAFQVINTAAKFPVGEHDDIESTLSMGWQYMRQYHGLQLPDDEDDQVEISPFKWKRKGYA